MSQRQVVRAQVAEQYWDRRLTETHGDSKARLALGYDRLRAAIEDLPEDQRAAARQAALNAIDAVRLQISPRRRAPQRRKEMAS